MKPLLSRFILHSMALQSPHQSTRSETETSSRPRITYWAGRGRAEPLRCILAAANVTFDNVFLENKQDLQVLVENNKLAYDQVPLVQIDGLNLVQTGPTAEYLAEAYGLMPQCPRERYTVGQIVAATRDAREPYVSYPFHMDETRLRTEIFGPKGLFGRYCVKWESQLAAATNDNNAETTTDDKGPYFLNTGPSLADVSVFELMDFHRHVFGEGTMRSDFDSFPSLLGLHDAVLDLGRLRTWRDEERPRLFISQWSEYADVVVRTLS